jgi:hypothetical protein
MRTARPSYVAAKARHPWPALDPRADVPELNVGAPGTVDALFCRDFFSEQITPTNFAEVPGAVTKPTTDKIIKSMINFELHGLMDCAVELADHFRPLLSHRFDVDAAIARLMHRAPYARNTVDVTECLRMMASFAPSCLCARWSGMPPWESGRFALGERQVALAERQVALAERDAALAERDAAIAQLASIPQPVQRIVHMVQRLIRRIVRMMPSSAWTRSSAPGLDKSER